MRRGVLVSILALALLTFLAAPQLRADEIAISASTQNIAPNIHFTLSGAPTSAYLNDALRITQGMSSFPHFNFGKKSAPAFAMGTIIEREIICVLPAPTISTPEPSPLLLLSAGLLAFLVTSAFKKLFI